MKPFAELGDQIERDYAAASHRPEAFPAIAADALQRARLHERVSVADVVAWLADAPSIPPQNVSSRFGEPPLTVYTAGRWVIDVLFWVEGRTTIHAHDFAGAFTVLAGASIQRRYAFSARTPDRGALVLGDLRMTDIALLRRGAVEPIVPGDALIHSVFHLERPTVSVVVRTDGGLLKTPQYDYWSPSVAIDPEHLDPAALRQQQTLAMLLRVGHASARPLVERSMARADLHAAFRLLDQVMGSPREAELLPRLVDIARERHGDAIDALLASLRQARWEHMVSERRRDLTDPELSFFLSALLTAPRRADVMRLVAERWPSRDPEAAVRAWVGALVGVGSTAGHEARVAAACARVVEGLTESRPLPTIAAELAEGPDGAALRASVGELEGLCASVRDGLLRPLFV